MKTLLVGLGNILMGDEGIGVHVINDIKQRYSFEPPLEILDGGTLGLDLLHFFEEKDDVVIVDAVNFKREPGYIDILRDDEIPSKINAKLTVHHIGLSDILSALKILGKTPKKITLIGIQPEILDMTLDMTSVVKERFNELIELVINELKEIGHKCVLLSPQK
ncbi:MAG TPA: HyaD/HybD family hydrogenase maturation endopeptidase [Nitrospirae bacterium]|nr:HyaD/HybD family hydrogenase maturation endopeptidase [Nitrospirota bacterium]